MNDRENYCRGCAWKQLGVPWQSLRRRRSGNLCSDCYPVTQSKISSRKRIDGVFVCVCLYKGCESHGVYLLVWSWANSYLQLSETLLQFCHLEGWDKATEGWQWQQYPTRHTSPSYLLTLDTWVSTFLSTLPWQIHWIFPARVCCVAHRVQLHPGPLLKQPACCLLQGCHGCP